MEALTPASPDSLPPLGELIADEPFWRYPIGTAREGVRGHEKVPVYGQVEVLAGGQLKVPIPRSPCRPEFAAWAATVAVSASHRHRPGSFY